LSVVPASFSSRFPSSLQLIALLRLEPNVFSVLISLEPVFAGLFGWILLSQNLSALKISAILLVVLASIIQTLAKPSKKVREPDIDAEGPLYPPTPKRSLRKRLRRVSKVRS